MHSRLITSYGGLVNYLPKYSLIFIIFILASLGLPGTSGFIGEFLVLVGAFQKNFLVAVFASIGVVLGAAYMLWLAKRVIFGETKNEEIKKIKDINILEALALILLIVPTIFIGFYPHPILDTLSVTVDNLISNYQIDLTLNLIGQK